MGDLTLSESYGTLNDSRAKPSTTRVASGTRVGTDVALFDTVSPRRIQTLPEVQLLLGAPCWSPENALGRPHTSICSISGGALIMATRVPLSSTMRAQHLRDTLDLSLSCRPCKAKREVTWRLNLSCGGGSHLFCPPV